MDRHRLRRLATVGAVLLLIISMSWPSSAKYASIILDAETGRVYHEVNADTRNYPAIPDQADDPVHAVRADRPGRNDTQIENEGLGQGVASTQVKDVAGTG